MNEEEEEMGRDDKGREGRRNKQPTTARNPKGAGRPSREVDRANRVADMVDDPQGWFARNFSDFFRRDDGSSEGHRGRDSKPKYRGYLGAVLKAFRFKEKDIEKIGLDKAEEFVSDVYKEVAPHALPHLMKPVAIVVGVLVWYYMEEMTVTKTMTRQEWLTVKDKYDWWGRSGGHVTLSSLPCYLQLQEKYSQEFLDEWDNKVTATRYRVPYRPLHFARGVLDLVLRGAQGILEGEFDIALDLMKTFGAFGIVFRTVEEIQARREAEEENKHYVKQVDLCSKLLGPNWDSGVNVWAEDDVPIGNIPVTEERPIIDVPERLL